MSTPLKVTYTRIPDEDCADPNLFTVHINLQLDATDQAALERFCRVLRELIPREDVPAFLDQLRKEMREAQHAG